MAKYRTKRPWLQTIKPEDGSKPTVILHEAGARVDYDGQPGDNLEPLDAAARKAAREAKEALEAQRREADLKATREGRSMLAALISALKGETVAEGSTATKRAPTFDEDEGPKVKAASPAKLGGPA